MNNLKKLFVAAAMGLTVTSTFASNLLLNQQSSNSAQTSPMELTTGEVKKIDKGSNKITIKHGDIKNLDMPGMTMVFKVKDANMLDAVKVGDKIKFRAEKSDGAIMVMEMHISN